MATLKEVLQYHPDYEGQGWHWRGDGDTYSGTDADGKPLGLLAWDAGNTLPQPTEAELDGKRAEADAAWLVIRRENLGRKLVTKTGDHLITALDILVDAVNELQAQIKSNALNNALTETNRIDTLRSRIDTLKARIASEA